MNAVAAALFAARLPAGDGPQFISAVDIALFCTVVGSMVLFGGAAVLALGWAFKTGQFDNFDRGSKSIFGPDEPIGAPTDAFPDAEPEVEAVDEGW
jgi:cbb3-type cytochrome oxidase maturation protein